MRICADSNDGKQYVDVGDILDGGFVVKTTPLGLCSSIIESKK
jgi:hypothetical protein